MARGKIWTHADHQHLRWYAERGFSAHETGRMMDRTEAAIARKALELRIAFHGPSSAPFGNQNGVRGAFKAVLRAYDRAHPQPPL